MDQRRLRRRITRLKRELEELRPTFRHPRPPLQDRPAHRLPGGLHQRRKIDAPEHPDRQRRAGRTSSSPPWTPPAATPALSRGTEIDSHGHGRTSSTSTAPGTQGGLPRHPGGTGIGRPARSGGRGRPPRTGTCVQAVEDILRDMDLHEIPRFLVLNKWNWPRNPCGRNCATPTRTPCASRPGPGQPGAQALVGSRWKVHQAHFGRTRSGPAESNTWADWTKKE